MFNNFRLWVLQTINLKKKIYKNELLTQLLKLEKAKASV